MRADIFIGKAETSCARVLGQMAGGGVYKDSFLACGHFLLVISTWPKIHTAAAPFLPRFLIFLPISLSPLPPSPLLVFSSGQPWPSFTDA